MRVIKAIVLFCFSMVAVSACFEAPEMSVIPRIDTRNLQFKEVGGLTDFDTLIINFSFKDGDGDLGLDSNFPPHSQQPYHSGVFYIGNSVGDTVRIYPTRLLTYNTVLGNTSPSTGWSIITGNTRTQNPAFNYLPVFNSAEVCSRSYNDTELLVLSTSNLVNPSTHNITATLHEVTVKKGIESGQIKLLKPEEIDNEYHSPTGRIFYRVSDHFLHKDNPLHNNIEIKFYRFVAGNYVEFDFFSQYCMSYDGRFPVLTEPGRATEGNFRYAIPNTSFVTLFGSDRWRITVRIRDRALHTSNTITYEFELDDIRV